MAEKYYGTIEELKNKISRAGIQGEWSEASGKHSFRSQRGGVLNWWGSKGTLLIQGSDEAQPELIHAISDESSKRVAQSQDNRQIFIVHGHDRDALDQLELVLHRLGLKPFILMNNSGGGKTIIEALEGKIGRDFNSAFGIVLMTPDDFGYAKKDGQGKAEPRARQNVILEAGMLLSSLTRERMAILVKGHMEMPSDLQGIIHLGYNDHVRQIVPKLCQRLKEAGFQIEPNQIADASQ